MCLIDEPELCLHPPQAYNLGKFIGRFGAAADTVTLVATHSSHLLRGVLQTTKELQVVRLTRRSRSFSAHHVPAQTLSDALTRPTLRAESVLDGIFAQGVVIVEADGDRLVYQTAWEAVNQDLRLDLHFATVGGSGGIADTCTLYRTLQIPVAVIADLDVIVDNDRISRILGALVDDHKERDTLVASAKAVAAEIRALPPTVSGEEVAIRLAALSRMGTDWAEADDEPLRRELRALANDMDRMRRLKRGGTKVFEGSLHQQLGDLIAGVGRYGLFLVPVGELEEWLSDYSVGISKSDKRAWSNAAAERLEKLGRQAGDVWDFISGVGRFLTDSPASAVQQRLAADRLSPAAET